jgi:uncharacterized protein DUF3800
LSHNCQHTPKGQAGHATSTPGFLTSGSKLKPPDAPHWESPPCPLHSTCPSRTAHEKFKEFHAYELFNGEGAFKGIDERKRFSAIQVLLMSLRHYNIPFIYGAIDEKKLANSSYAKGLFGTARPVSAAFRLCALGVEDWARKRHAQFDQGVALDYADNYLLIADNTTDQELKKQLQTSYKVLRSSHPYSTPKPHDNRLWHSHDEMYFGDSVSCLGIQLADLCTYFMQRHLLKRDKTHRDKADEFFNLIKPSAICAKPEPEWSEYREFLVHHDDNKQEDMLSLEDDANTKGQAAQ